MATDLLLLGNLIVDDLVFDDGRTRMGQPGGAMVYATLGAAVWGTRVAVVAPVGNDYPRDVLDAMVARGVDLSGLRPLGRAGLRAWLRYERNGRRIIHQPSGATHADASPNPEDLHGSLALAPAFHIAPTPVECQARLIDALAERSGVHVSLDPHDPIREDTLDRWRPLLPRVDLLFVSREEIDLPGIDVDPCAPLSRLMGGRLMGVALKRGSEGGVHCGVAAPFSTPWPPCAERVVDPTGAGDAFAGGFLSGRLAGLTLKDSLVRGAVSASYAIQDWGPAGLLHATLDDARRRFAAWHPAFAG